MTFVPQATSSAGLCLSMNDWSLAGIKALSFSLESLLIKPGVALLKSIRDIRQYLPWPGVFIFNAGQIHLNKEGNCTVISPFDGSKCTLSCSELIEIVLQLKPDLVILPKDSLKHAPKLFANWDESIFPYFGEEDLQQEIKQPHGMYFNLEDPKGYEHWMTYLQKSVRQPCYVAGKINLELMKQLHTKDVQWIESNEPAEDAVQGRVYSSNGLLDLMEDRHEQIFETIDTHCLCSICSQPFTQAYLHHLLIHTPLLCQRYLIAHNLGWLQNALLEITA